MNSISHDAKLIFTTKAVNNKPLWHIDYCELKAERQQVQKHNSGLGIIPQKQETKFPRKAYHPYPQGQKWK
jgi:hypothetical protein